jgi:dihydrodipicolinate synthase/N-acetylneuraminate lyase
LKHGITVFSSTGGNTKYATLTFDEVKQVNRVMIEAVGQRGLVIAATGDWTTDQAVSFAKCVEGVGAAAVQVQRPKAVAEDEDGTVMHYEAVAKATKLPLVLHGKFSDALLGRLARIDSVAAMKEDHTLEDYVRQQIDFGSRMVIFGGGGENRIYVGWPYGAKAYYSTYSTFAPDISTKVWKAIQAGNIQRAAALTAKYDYPYIRRFTHGQ